MVKRNDGKQLPPAALRSQNWESPQLARNTITTPCRIIAAIERLARDEHTRLLQSIRARMGPAVTATCQPDDILQDALTKALSSADRAPGPELDLLRAWILGIARHRILDLVRGSRKRTRPRRSTPLPQGALVFHDELDLIPSESREGHSLGAREDASRAIDRLGGLPRDQRISIVLHDILDLPWETVAFALRRSRPAARKLHERARRHLTR